MDFLFQAVPEIFPPGGSGDRTFQRRLPAMAARLLCCGGMRQHVPGGGKSRFAPACRKLPGAVPGSGTGGAAFQPPEQEHGTDGGRASVARESHHHVRAGQGDPFRGRERAARRIQGRDFPFHHAQRCRQYSCRISGPFSPAVPAHMVYSQFKRGIESHPGYGQQFRH